MDNSDRPAFTPEVEFQIEQIQNQADLFAWQQLQALQVPTPIAQKMKRAAYPSQPFGPPDPKRPNEIRMHIRNYARTLYFAEGNHYQDGPHIENQLKKLAVRIVQRIGETVADVEEAGIKVSISLAHHGLSAAQMQSTALDEVTECIEKRLVRVPASSRSPLPPKVQSQMAGTLKCDDSVAAAYAVEALPVIQLNGSAAGAGDTEKQRREKLLADYKAATGGPSNKRIYEARNSGIHKPQFYEWRYGTLPNGSETARNFERFLREKKLPIPRRPKD